MAMSWKNSHKPTSAYTPKHPYFWKPSHYAHPPEPPLRRHTLRGPCPTHSKAPPRMCNKGYYGETRTVEETECTQFSEIGAATQQAKPQRMDAPFDKKHSFGSVRALLHAHTPLRHILVLSLDSALRAILPKFGHFWVCGPSKAAH